MNIASSPRATIIPRTIPSTIPAIGLWSVSVLGFALAFDCEGNDCGDVVGVNVRVEEYVGFADCPAVFSSDHVWCLSEASY